MDYNFYLGLFTVLATVFTLYGAIKYKTFLNVLSINLVMFSLSIIIAIPHYMLFPSNTPESARELAALTSIIYIFGITLPFMINTGFLTKKYHEFIVYFKFDNTYRQMKYKSFVLYGFLVVAGVFFFLLMIQSGAGTLWLTSPRDAYMDNRQGVGYLYALTMWALMFGYIFYFWFARPKHSAVFVLFIFSFLAYFLASKGFILYFWIVFVFYWHYLVKSIKNNMLIFGGAFIFSLFLGVQLAQGTASEFSDTIKYFIYFDSTAMFLSIFDQVGYQYGSAFIGQFWEMVPRSLVPDKPIVYGQYLIHETLNPGLLENGRAVGTLKWTKYYLDFGVFGVFFVGFIDGFIMKTVYNYFLRHRDNPFAFIIMIQLGVITIFNYATTLIVFILLILFALWLRIWGTYNRRGIILEK